MLRNSPRGLAAASFALWIGAIACAGLEPGPAGFLEPYGRFEPAADGNGALVQWAPRADLSRYEALLIDPVEIWYSPEASYRGIAPDELKRLADGFHDALVEAVEDAYPVVDAPGPGVLRLRVAITDVIPSRPRLNLVTAVVPGSLVASNAKRALTGSHLNVGQAAMEAELVDSTSGARLVAVIDRKAGSKLPLRQGATEWGHVETLFERWAERLRRRLDEAHGRSAAK